MINKIRIRVFRAVDDPETCEKFIFGHRRILEIYYGIIKITSDSNEWIHDPYTIVIVAEDSVSKVVYGGAKVQVYDGKTPLPIESAISKYDTGVKSIIWRDYINGGTSELCGVWNSKEIAGMGIGSHILTKVAVAIASQVGILSMYVLCAPGTVRIAEKHGFEIETSIGNNGLFFYPKDDFVATVMRLNNINELASVKENELNKILLLREQTNIVLDERGPKGTFQVTYNLKVKNWDFKFR